MKTRWLLSLWLLAAAIAAAGCHHGHRQHNLPPAQRLMEPGPGVGGPGPGVIPPAGPMPVVPAAYHGPMLGHHGHHGHPPSIEAGPMYAGSPYPAVPTAQVWFVIPEGAMVRWDVTAVGCFDSTPLVIPGRQNFPQGAIYRLKLTNIEGFEGVELYPTLEITPATPRSDAYLAHNAIPVAFTNEDLTQVMAGNFVTKVIYLPDPEFQDVVAGVETIVSTRLDPGIDPVVEADRRGAILAIVRVGNKDLETPGGGHGVAPVNYNQPPAFDGIPPEQLPPSPYAAPAPGYYGGAYPAHDPNCPPGEGGQYGPPMAFGPSGVPPPYVVGVTSPMYGMPYVGTPIGLPGPPHIPLGGPARLQQHSMWNWTHHHFPRPVHKQTVHMKQRPGFSYPHPPRRMHIRTEMIHPAESFHQPIGDKFHVVNPGYVDGYPCPPGQPQ